MSTPSRPAGSEPYIVAMANQADRANRPTRFIVFGVLLILACCIYMLFGVKAFVESNARLERQLGERLSTEQQLQKIEELRGRSPDLETLYPAGALLMPNHLSAAARSAFANNPDTETEPGFFTISSDVDQKPLETSRGLLNNNTVTVSVAGARQIPIEDILLFIQTALEEDPSEIMFLSEIELRPVPQGWQARTIEFRRYSYNRQ